MNDGPAIVLGLIPARGGSKGIPRKNLRPLGGKALIVHTVEAARAARTLDRVIVSTDDVEIADVAWRAGAEVPFLRPAEFATDTAPSIAVAHHALGWLHSHGGGYRPDAIALLAPTAPLRTSRQIDEVVRLLSSAGVDSACTIRESPAHPYYIYRRDEHGRLSFVLHDVHPRPLRRQDLPVFFTHTQAVLVSRRRYLETSGAEAAFLNFTSLAGFEIDPVSAHDIDTPMDLEIAEQFYQARARMAS